MIVYINIGKNIQKYLQEIRVEGGYIQPEGDAAV